MASGQELVGMVYGGVELVEVDWVDHLSACG